MWIEADDEPEENPLSVQSKRMYYFAPLDKIDHMWNCEKVNMKQRNSFFLGVYGI